MVFELPRSTDMAHVTFSKTTMKKNYKTATIPGRWTYDSKILSTDTKLHQKVHFRNVLETEKTLAKSNISKRDYSEEDNINVI